MLVVWNRLVIHKDRIKKWHFLTYSLSLLKIAWVHLCQSREFGSQILNDVSILCRNITIALNQIAWKGKGSM